MKTTTPLLCLHLLPLCSSIWMSACMPPTEPADAKYNISSYIAVQDDSGSLAGTWVLTSNKPYAEADAWQAIKARALFRLRPVEGSNTELEVVYCEPERKFQVTTASTDGAMLTLNIAADSPIYTSVTLVEPFTITDNNHLRKTVVSAGGVNHEFRAVKISNDPSYDIGTVSTALPFLNISAPNQSAKCLSEVEYNFTSESHHWLTVSGSNGEPVAATGQLLTVMRGGSSTAMDFSIVENEDGESSWSGEGLYSPSTNTVASSSKSITGSAALRAVSGSSPVPTTLSKTTFKISL